MKFSENWLRTLIDPSYLGEELAYMLTMAGLEVESLEPAAPEFDKVVVAQVLSVEKHPTADRLQVCSVDVGKEVSHKTLQIVCGASNVQAGIKVPCALINARLPNIVIHQAELRGVSSEGMLCSAKELGLNDAADGLLLLSHDATIGEDFRKFYALEDKIFSLSLTPNRADCLGLFGVAREVAAITDSALSPLKIEPAFSKIVDSLNVHVVEPVSCPLYCGRIIREIRTDVLTPVWIVRRLECSGIRPINPVVDVTNYVMLETGQPMHAFDLAKVTGSIQVRNARAGEHMQLLNGYHLNLQSDMLLIADQKGPLALAGIMGSIDSGVADGTKDIFLESAFFNPAVINGKSFSLGFGSESSHRFERGVDFAATRDVLERATNLIVEICGGKSGPVTEVKSELPQRLSVRVRVSRVNRVLGVNIDKQKIADIFRRLNFNFTSDGDIFYVIPPTFRFDLAIEEDFIEEVARIYGYDNISAKIPNSHLTMLSSAETVRTKSQFQQTLVAREYQEVINYAFIDAAWESDFSNNQAPIVLQNPIASQMSVMRSSLLGGLIANLQFNLNRNQARVRLFEIGCCFFRDGNSNNQSENLAGLCYGDVVPEQWGESSRAIDFYDVKADIEAICWPSNIYFEPASHAAMHPGKTARILIENRNVGWIGEVHPRWQSKYGLPKPAVLFELQLDKLVTKSLPVAKELSKYPLIRRDIAVIVPNHINVQSILAYMYAEKISIVTEISLFDIYRGKGIDEDKKSLAFRILLQDTEKTLTDQEADSVITNLIKILERKVGAKLRN